MRERVYVNLTLFCCMNRTTWIRVSCSICLMCWINFARAQNVFDDIIVNNSTSLNGTTTINGSVFFESFSSGFDTETALSIGTPTNGPVRVRVTDGITFGPESAISGQGALSLSQLNIRFLEGVMLGDGNLIKGLTLNGRTVFEGDVTFISKPKFNKELVVPDMPVRWGNTGAMLRTDQGASIELRGEGVPYIDFSDDSRNPNADFDMRLILADNDILGIDGGTLALGEGGALRRDPLTFRPFKVYVEGSTFAERVKNPGTVDCSSLRTSDIMVPLEENFPDFVFEKDYDLAPLKEVAKYIQEHGHLKDVPSAEEVRENGLELTAFQQQLLLKVEELTLYAIDKQKKIHSLKETYQQKMRILQKFHKQRILPLKRQVQKLKTFLD